MHSDCSGSQTARPGGRSTAHGEWPLRGSGDHDLPESEGLDLTALSFYSLCNYFYYLLDGELV